MPMLQIVPLFVTSKVFQISYFVRYIQIDESYVFLSR